MAEKNTQFDSLNEKTKLINSALKYTDGDVDKARLMVSGQLNDIVALKGRFYIDQKGYYGIILIFFNILKEYIVNINSYYSKLRSVYDRAKINDIWKSFYVDFKNYIKDASDTVEGSFELNKHMYDVLAARNIFEDVEYKNIDELTKVMREILCKFFDVEKVQCQIDLNDTNSISLELEGVPIELKEESGEADDAIESEYDKKIAAIEAEADFLIPSRIILSPVKGKYIYDVKRGDTIKVLFTNKNDELSCRVAKTLNSLHESGDFLPVKARIKEIIKGALCTVWSRKMFSPR
jgi:hypothetical protein